MRNQHAECIPLATVPRHMTLTVKSKSTPREKGRAKTVGNGVGINENYFSPQRKCFENNNH